MNQKNELETPYQTSWGVSTRMIGGLIMTHSDDAGLVLPPKIAPIKIAIIPIKNTDEVNSIVSEITDKLDSECITYYLDDTDKSPGFKFANAEVRGIRLESKLGHVI